MNASYYPAPVLVPRPASRLALVLLLLLLALLPAAPERVPLIHSLPLTAGKSEPAQGDQDGPELALSSAPERTIPAGWEAAASPAELALRGLPAEWAGRAELVGQRTAHSATFAGQDGGYESVVSSAPLHYRDASGLWQPIDPSFRLDTDEEGTPRSFVVEANGVRSRAGLRQPWLAAGSGETALQWRAIELGYVGWTGAYNSLATAHPAGGMVAAQRTNNTVLHYADGWSDPALAEQIVSAAGSVEHLLLLAEPPRAPAGAQHLELRARLALPPGSTLWADGQAQAGSFSTEGALEIRTAAGETTLVLDPVLAFEQENRSQVVGGSYRVTPGAEAGEWIVGVRTPLAWWLAPERVYPAAIDPTMRVLRTSGAGTGLAWVAQYIGLGDAVDENYNLGEMVLGRMMTDPYYGFMQFNVMPATLTQLPVEVKEAHLRITPSYFYIPWYKHDSDDGPDWDEKTITHNVRLWSLNLASMCPDPLADPDCWSMIDDRLATKTSLFNWDTVPEEQSNGSETIEIGTGQLAVGPKVQGGKGQTTTFDVTGAVQDWYATSPQPNHGPAFMLRTSASAAMACNFPPTNKIPGPPPPYQIIDAPSKVPKCTRFIVGPDKVQLHVSYDALPLSLTDNVFNAPGVPSFYEGLLEDSYHEYKLATNGGPTAWRAVAARSNHALFPLTPGRADLQIYDQTGDQMLLDNTGSNGLDQTSFVLINDFACNSGICDTGRDVRARVLAAADNNYADDQSRNYRIDAELGTDFTPVINGYGTFGPFFLGMKSDNLVRVKQLDLAKYDNVAFSVTTAPEVQVVLARPTPNNGPLDPIVNGNALDNTAWKQIAQNGTQQTLSNDLTEAPVSGKWALAFYNTDHPFPDPNEPVTVGTYGITVDIIRCPYFAVPTANHECQPLRLPHTGTATRPVAGLTIYSEGGFTLIDGNGNWCTDNEGAGAPLIGPSVAGRYAAVVNGRLCWDGINESLYTTDDSAVGVMAPHPLSPGTYGKVTPGYAFGHPMLSLPLDAGVKTGATVYNAEADRLEALPDTLRNITPFLKKWGMDLSTDENYVSISAMEIQGDVTIDASVSVEAGAAPLPISWDIPWRLYPNGGADGYTFLATPDQLTPFHAAGSFVDLASLEVRLEGTVGEADTLDHYAFDKPMAYQLRQGAARVTQPPGMGGASKLAVVTILPRGAPRLPTPPAGAQSCGGGLAYSSCLDVRHAGYAWANGDGDKALPMWELPDIHVDGTAGTVAASGPGGVAIFTDDHPLAAPNAAAAVNQSFSFDTWDATVTIAQEVCGSGPLVTVVRGEAQIGLPGIGEAGVPPLVNVSFKLCETEMKEALLELQIPPPGLPIGSSGLGVNVIGGQITFGPSSTQVLINVAIQSLDGAVITGGYGSVLIDTAGKFELAAGAELVGLLNADLTLSIAWQPLDVLLQANINCCGGLIYGELYMHGWLGQGFQNAYPWLPDNDDFHFTGYVKAGLFIESDYVAPLLPPFDIDISVKISFGEFCTNSSCTNYDWGMSATLTIVGTTIGLYVDSGGPDFIFGSDDHVLIDQFGGGSSAPFPVLAREVGLAAAPLAPAAPPPGITLQPPGWFQIQMPLPVHSSSDDWPVDSPADHGCTGNAGGPALACDFNVGSGARQAVFMATWENGDLNATLTAPDSTLITPGNAATYGVTISETQVLNGGQVLFVAQPPAGQPDVISGNWTLDLSNIGAGLPGGIDNNYRLTWWTDPLPPEITWTTPVVSGTTPTAGQILLEWQALRGGLPLPDSVEMELVYTPVISKPVDPTDFTGILITNRYTASLGSYAWNVGGLASGEYAVGARLDDRFSGNGAVVSWAPGTVEINDTTPPPPPLNLTSASAHDAIILEFDRPTTPDLAGYLVEHTFPRPGGVVDTLTRRIHPRGKWVLHLTGQQVWLEGKERIRLGSVLDGFTSDICVRAYDNSSNVGNCATIQVTVGLGSSLLLKPQELSISPTAGGNFNINWRAPVGDPPAGYVLTYSPLECLLPDAKDTARQGAPPLDVGNVTSFQLSGLTPGQLYTIGITAYGADGILGETSSIVARFGLNADHLGNGMDDDWETAWNLFTPNSDEDGDGATTIQEHEMNSNPWWADSDGDGVYDGEERVAGTDACDPTDASTVGTGPKMTLHAPPLRCLTAAVNQTAVLSYTVGVFNTGGGDLTWTATTTETWLLLDQHENHVDIGLVPGALPPGQHRGTVWFTSDRAGPAAIQEQVAVTIPACIQGRAQFDPAAAVDVLPAALGDDVHLEWQHLAPNVYYEVYGANLPYFGPGARNLLETNAPPGGATEANVLALGTWRFYVVRAVGGSGDSADSNRTGVVQYELVPGE